MCGGSLVISDRLQRAPKDGKPDDATPSLPPALLCGCGQGTRDGRGPDATAEKPCPFAPSSLHGSPCSVRWCKVSSRYDGSQGGS